MENEELVKIGKAIFRDSTKELEEMLAIVALERRQTEIKIKFYTEKELNPTMVGWYQGTLVDLDHEEKLIRKELTNKTYKLKALKGEVVHDGRYTEEEVARAKEATIETFYQGKLRKSGGRLTGRCPFHEERSASFFIYSKDNSFHCFGCQAHGDSIEFVMKLHKLDFRQAVKFMTN